MPPLRIYFDFILSRNIDELEKLIKSDSNNFAQFDDNQNSLTSGFRQSSNIFRQISNEYYVADYFEIGIKTLPSYYTELHYFKYIDKIIETEEKPYPILIKIIFNYIKKVICFYSKQTLKNEIADNLIIKLKDKHHFKFDIAPTNYIFKKDKLDDFVNALGIKDYTAISIYDKDNITMIKNPKKITETEKFITILNEYYRGNWGHIKVPFDDLKMELRINNNTQRFLTFQNDYIDEDHLIRVINFIVEKIIEVSNFNGKQQFYLDKFL